MGKYTQKYLEKYNWEDIQSFYDKGNNWSDIVKSFKITFSGLSFACKNGKFKSRSKKESNKLERLKNPRTHSEETKKKISESIKKYLENNPNKVPYLLNHSSKESYPEKYFTELFLKEGIILESNYRIGLYELDFCIVNKKIDIEIDGDQHYLDNKIVESDIRRTKYLENK